MPNATNSYLSTCLNNQNTDPYCPVFLIKDILNSVEPDQNEQTQIFLKVTKIIKKFNRNIYNGLLKKGSRHFD